MVNAFSREAAQLGEARRQSVKDLRIACIALAHDAMLPTCNTVDFAQVPGSGLKTRWIEKHIFP